MKYTLAFSNSTFQYISVQIETKLDQPAASLFLPYWRPGRYTRQDYPRYIGAVEAWDAKGNSLRVQRKSTHEWRIQNKEAGPIRIQYQYFADQIEAGGSYLDQDTIYVNGINLLLYQKDKLNQRCQLSLQLPSGFQLAAGFPGNGPVYDFEDYHQLVDSPFFAARDLQHQQFELDAIPIHLWFMGACKPDWQRIEKDIRAYSQAQLDLFDHFPTDQYHYLYFIQPKNYRHGVEHYNSTVISMGPGIRMMEEDQYRSFLEISSHEFFHTWNVKALRPADMLPYDYSGPNYSELHYVTEGLTTYYGDLMLWKGGVWNENQWMESINGALQRHYRMGGKDEISLSEASFNSWVNGYTSAGMPNRRISFYTKGYLVSMLLDFEIRRASKQLYSLDDVIHHMYHQFGRKGIGYTRADYQHLIEHFAGRAFDTFFEQYIYGTQPLDPLLKEMAGYYGLFLHRLPLGDLAESAWGIQGIRKASGGFLIENLLPNSPAAKAGLYIGDTILSVGGIEVRNNWRELIVQVQDLEEVEIHAFHRHKLQKVRLPALRQLRYHLPQFFLLADPSETQRQNLFSWRAIRQKARV